jgi:HEAT repeat protein
MQKKSMMIFFLVIVISGLSFPVLSQDEEPVDQETEIRNAIDTLNQAIVDDNDPMRNKMYFKFRLIEQDNPGVVAPYLIDNLKSDRPGVTEYTAFVLGWIDDQRAVKPLREMLVKTDSQKIAAARALGFMRAEESIPDIIALLDDPNPRVRGDAAYSLGLMGSDKANAALQKATRDPDELVQYFAKEALQRIEDYKKFGW